MRAWLPVGLRWLIGAPLAVLTGVGTILIPAFQIQHGWEWEASLIWVIYAWVFAGSILFLARREAGRRILRGAGTAFVAFSVFALLTEPYGSAFPLKVYYILAATMAAGVFVAATLSLPVVQVTMREAREID